MLRVAGRTAEVAAGDALFVANLPRVLTGGPAAPGDVLELTGDPPRAREVRGRTSILARGVARGGTRVIAANAELLIVVVAVRDPEPDPAFIDRYLAAGELGGLRPIITVTKTDLDHDESSLAALVSLYQGIGYQVEVGSARAPDLAGRLRGHIGSSLAVLAGHSGVGKSTLTTALTGQHRATSAVSEKAGTGRHTTTDPRMIPLEGGGAVIDTAGVRAFHLAPRGDARLHDGFPEIAALASECRFRGCRHRGEDGCAVEGAVPASRLSSYRRLLDDD